MSASHLTVLSTRRHSARPVSMPIGHPRETKVQTPTIQRYYSFIPSRQHKAMSTCRIRQARPKHLTQERKTYIDKTPPINRSEELERKKHTSAPPKKRVDRALKRGERSQETSQPLGKRGGLNNRGLHRQTDNQTHPGKVLRSRL